MMHDVRYPFVERLLKEIWDELEWQRLEAERKHNWYPVLNHLAWQTTNGVRTFRCTHCSMEIQVRPKQWRPHTEHQIHHVTKEDKKWLGRPLKFQMHFNPHQLPKEYQQTETYVKMKKAGLI